MPTTKREFLIVMMLLGAFIGSAFGYVTLSHAKPIDEPMVRIEITRDIPHDQTYTIVMEFNDMEDLAMWFANKMETTGCDPYVTKVELFPLGKGAHRE